VLKVLPGYMLPTGLFIVPTLNVLDTPSAIVPENVSLPEPTSQTYKNIYKFAIALAVLWWLGLAYLQVQVQMCM
jgi:hypothetical protein